MTNPTTFRVTGSSSLRLRLGASATALVLALGATAPAFADITNTATVTGTSPSSTPVTSNSNTVNVDPVDAVSSLTIVKTAAITTDADSDNEGDAGDVVTYTYTVTNSGNVSLASTDIVDTHDGSGPAPTPLFDSWTTQAGSPPATTGDASITMYPGAVAVFKATYTITAQDILDAGGTGVGASADDDIDNSAVASGDYFNGSTTTPVSSTASLASVTLDILATMTVAKVAYTGGLPPSLGGTGVVAADNLTAGTVVTYVYTVTNTGNVPTTSVGVTDSHNGTGTFTQPTLHSFTNLSGLSINDDSIDSDPNKMDRIGPLDIAYFTTNYTITQSDVDQRQ